jgi:hypothetical protein
MTTWRRDQTGNDTDEIVVHVARVSQSRRRSSHHC